MRNNIKALIQNKDYEGLKAALSKNPTLANEGIPYDDVNTTKAHPLHRICDGVCAGLITDEEAVIIAKIFLEYGADVNGNVSIEKQDTPLVAAASLNADEVALLYIDEGANIHHAGCHGGTALHWAAWCGRDKVVKRLVEQGAAINKRCIDFKATPLFWAVHGLKNGNVHHQVECARILIEAGANKTIPNVDGHSVFELLGDEDAEMRTVLG